MYAIHTQSGVMYSLASLTISLAEVTSFVAIVL